MQREIHRTTRWNDADFSFRTRPLDYTGAITRRAIIARNQPTRFARRLHPARTKEGIARDENGTSCAGSHTVVVVVVVGNFSPRPCIKPFSFCRMYARAVSALVRESDVLAELLLFLALRRLSREPFDPFTVGRHLSLPAALPPRSLLFSHLRDAAGSIPRDYIRDSIVNSRHAASDA